jgi:hypothetical protein
MPWSLATEGIGTAQGGNVVEVVRAATLEVLAPVGWSVPAELGVLASVVVKGRTGGDPAIVDGSAAEGSTVCDLAARRGATVGTTVAAGEPGTLEASVAAIDEPLVKVPVE